MTTRKHTLPDHFVEQVANLLEFANGGTQVSMKLKDGTVQEKLLISNCTNIIAMRGYDNLPFSVSEIVEIFQTEEDKNPSLRGGWNYWDTP